MMASNSQRGSSDTVIAMTDIRADTQDDAQSEQEGDKRTLVAGENPVICVACKTPKFCKIPVAVISSCLGMVIFMILGIFFALFILPYLQLGLMAGVTCCGCSSVDETIKTLRCVYSSRCCKCCECGKLSCPSCSECTVSSFKEGIIKLPLKILYFGFYPIFWVVRATFYFIYKAMGVVGTGMLGLLWCPFVGFIVGMLASPQIVWKMMSGEMRKDTAYDIIEKTLVKLRLLVVHEKTRIKGKDEIERRVEGSEAFFWILGVSVYYVAIVPTGTIFAIVLWPIGTAALCISLFIVPVIAKVLHSAYTTRSYVIVEDSKEDAEDAEEDTEEDAEVDEEENKVQKFMDEYNAIIKTAQEERLKNAGAILSPEEEYWAMMAFLLIDEGTIWVHNLLHDHIQSIEEDVPKFFSTPTTTFILNQARKGNKKAVKRRNLNIPRCLSDEQYYLICPEKNPKSVDTSKFDLTLLIILIGILEVRPEPTCSWSASDYPDETDADDDVLKRDATNLVRMRFMRNTLYAHIVECELPKEKFNKYYPKLQDILKSFGADLSEVTAEKLKKAKENREHYVDRITTLFTGDARDAEDFAQKKLNQIAANHGPLDGFKMYMEFPDGTRHEK